MSDTIEIVLWRDTFGRGNPLGFVRRVAWPTLLPLPKQHDTIHCETLDGDAQTWVISPWVVVRVQYEARATEASHPARAVELDIVYFVRPPV